MVPPNYRPNHYTIGISADPLEFHLSLGKEKAREDNL